MDLHVHNHLANGKWPQKLEHFWGWIVEKLRTYDVKVHMGDSNMSLFKVFPELRSRGVVVDLGAWPPWKSFAGTAMSDSCGIFCVNMPGEYELCKDLWDLLREDERGILVRAEPAVAGAPKEHGFDRCAINGGPGQPLPMYLPKAEKYLANQLTDTLTPSAASEAAVAAKGAGKGQRNVQCLRVREKRLSADLWRCDGQQYSGSHFPICTFTNNVGRRSPAKLVERAERMNRHASSRSGGGASRRGASWQDVNPAWVASPSWVAEDIHARQD